MKVCITVFCSILAALLCCGVPGEACAKDMELCVNQAQIVTFATPVDTVFVAEPKVATYQVITPTRVLVFGRGPGRTSFMALNEEGSPIYSTSIRVTYDTALMQAALEREFPSLTLKLTPTAQGVIVSGEVPSAQVAAQVIALLDAFVDAVVVDSATASGQSGGGGGSSSSEDSPTEMPDDDLSGPGTGRDTMGASHGKVINRLTVTMPNQVMIRVRFAEVSRDISEQLGINWFWGHSVKAFGRSFVFGLTDTSITSTQPQEWDFLTSLGQSLPDFSVMIDALAGENLVSVLAEPNLAATSGETASFLAGGQIPVPEVGDSGNVGATYKDFGVMLNVTPTVLSGNRISLRVRPEVSDVSEAYSLSSSYGTIPGLTVRRAETTIELASGQSFVIGGLLQSNISNVVSKFPGLGDVPVLGALFRSSEFVRGETELVIIVTAYIGQPSGNNLRIPNANIIIPNVFNRLFIGMQPTVSSGPLRPDDLIY